MSFRNFFRFSLLVLTATGFSLGLLYARLISDEEVLSEVIRLQSYVVFLSFFLQLGFRAAIRKYIYNSRLRIAKLMDSFLYCFLLFFSVVGVFFEYLMSSYYFISLSSLLAWLTFKFTVSIVEDNDKSFIFYSFMVFLCAFTPSISISLVSLPFDLLYFVQELLSVTILLFFMLGNEFKKSYLSKGRVIINALIEAHYYQIGSGVMYLIVFMLAQLVLLSGYDVVFLKAYADIQILSGFFVLFVGKLLLLCEKKVFTNKDIRFKVFLLLVTLVILTVLSTTFVFSFINNYNTLFLLVVSFVLLSRPVMGYVVQYFMSFQFNLVMIFVSCFLAWLYFGVGLEHVNVLVICLPVLFFYIYVLLVFNRSRYLRIRCD